MFGTQHGFEWSRALREVLLLVLLGALLAAASERVPAAALGMLSDDAADRIAVFNADTDLVRNELEAEPGQALGDCAIRSDERLGFSSNSSSLLSFIDLTESGATLSSLPISNLGVDMALSPDEEFLVAAGGGALSQPLSVVDIERREEIALGNFFLDHTSAEFCDDGTLLVTTTHGKRFGSADHALYDARLDGTGQIRLMGGRISSGAQPNNGVCAPGSRSGVMLDRAGGLTSFTLPALSRSGHVQTRGETVISAVFNRDGRRLYVRTSHTVEAFDFDPATGAMARSWVREAPLSSTFYGMDQIAIHPHGDKLYVDGGSELMILDPLSGGRSGSISAGDATGVCFANRPQRVGQPAGGSAARGVAAP